MNAGLILSLLLAGPLQDPAPTQPSVILGESRFRHDSTISQGVFSTDGTRLYTGSFDQTIRTWDVKTGRELQRFAGHSGGTLCVALSPDEKLLASGGKDGVVRIWDLTAKDSSQSLAGHTGPVRSIAFTKHGIFSGGEDGVILQWDSATGKTVRTLKGHEDHILALTLSPDGTLLASGSKDATIRLWETATGKERSVIKGHEINVNSLAFSPDGARLASGAGWDWVPFHEKDRTARVWDVATGEQVFKGSGFTRSVQLVAFSPDGASIVAASSDKSVRIWDLASGKNVTPFNEPLTYWYSALITPDGKRLATLFHTARFWDLSTGKELDPANHHTGEIHAIAYSPDRTRIATAGSDRTLRVWDAVSGRLLQTLQGHLGVIKAVAYSPDGKYLASGSEMSPGGEVRLWDASTGKFLREQLGRMPGKFLAFLKSRPVIAFGERDVTLWDYEKDAVVSRQPLPVENSHHVTGFALLPDEKTVLFAATKGLMGLFDTSTGTQVGEFALPRSEKNKAWTTCALSPDGRILVSSGQGEVKLWDVRTRRELQVIPSPKSNLSGLVFSHDGRWFASQEGSSKNVVIWETSTFKEAFRFSTHAVAYRTHFSPNGRSLVVGGWDGTVRIYDLSPPKPVKPDIRELWKALLEKDGLEAYEATWAISSAGAEGAALLARELTRPAPAPEKLKSLIQGLEAAELDAREGATKELVELGLDIESALIEALDATTSQEAKDRLRAIIELANHPMSKSREMIRRARAVHALELAGTDEAVAALKSISTTAINHRIREEASASILRLQAKQR